MWFWGLVGGEPSRPVVKLCPPLPTVPYCTRDRRRHGRSLRQGTARGLAVRGEVIVSKAARPAPSMMRALQGAKAPMISLERRFGDEITVGSESMVSLMKRPQAQGLGPLIQ